MASKPKTLSDQLRRAVDESGRSRNQICIEIGLDPSQMSRFMAGTGFLSEQSMDRLGEALRLRIVADTPKSKKDR
jgi:hypothetical protein